MKGVGDSSNRLMPFRAEFKITSYLGEFTCHQPTANPHTRAAGTGFSGVQNSVPQPVPQRNPCTKPVQFPSWGRWSAMELVPMTWRYAQYAQPSIPKGSDSGPSKSVSCEFLHTSYTLPTYITVKLSYQLFIDVLIIPCTAPPTISSKHSVYLP